MNSIALFLKVSRPDITSLVFLFEGYNHLVIISTVDSVPREKKNRLGCSRPHGIVMLQTAPGNEPEVMAILHSVRAEIPWEIVQDFSLHLDVIEAIPEPENENSSTRTSH